MAGVVCWGGVGVFFGLCGWGCVAGAVWQGLGGAGAVWRGLADASPHPERLPLHCGAACVGRVWALGLHGPIVYMRVLSRLPGALHGPLVCTVPCPLHRASPLHVAVLSGRVALGSVTSGVKPRVPPHPITPWATACLVEQRVSGEGGEWGAL